MPFQTLSDYCRNNNFTESFSAVFDSWFEIIDQYARETEGDAIYWYTEKANVAAFNMALTRNDIPSIEEYSAYKGEDADPILGRVDLAFKPKWDRENSWYLVEAKLKWVGITRQHTLDFNSLMEDAREDALDSYQQNRDMIPLGMTFIVPWIQSNTPCNEITEKVKDTIKQLEDTHPGAFWAYCAPGRLRELQSTQGNHSYYPMVILLGERVV
jgi:hypothetical protein